jgi:hypothetical protein
MKKFSYTATSKNGFGKYCVNHNACIMTEFYKPNRKGGHRRNAIYNAFHRIVFRSKNARQIDPKQKQEWREIFEMQVFGGMNPWNRINFLDILKKGKHFKKAKRIKEASNER